MFSISEFFFGVALFDPLNQTHNSRIADPVWSRGLLAAVVLAQSRYETRVHDAAFLRQQAFRLQLPSEALEKPTGPIAPVFLQQLLEVTDRARIRHIVSGLQAESVELHLNCTSMVNLFRLCNNG